LVLVAGACPGAADDPVEIVRRALRINNADRELERKYTYTERQVERSLDSSGKVKRVKTETWDIVPLEGAQFRRLVARDDRPLTAREEADQEAERRKQEAERQKRRAKREQETAEDKRKREETRERTRKRQQEEIDNIVEGFDLRIVSEEQVGGVPVWVIDASPRARHKFMSWQARAVFSKMKGRVWIAKSDYHPVWIEAEAIDTISFGLFLARVHKGTRIQVEFGFFNNEVWLPVRQKATISARIALLKGFHEEHESVFTNYRKFSTDSRVVE
jgi:hypothetical protein